MTVTVTVRGAWGYAVGKMWTWPRVLFLGGVVAAGVVAAVASGTFGSRPLRGDAASGQLTATASGEIDYNCSLPGLGLPWLRHEPVPMTLPTYMAGFFLSTVTSPSTASQPYAVFLPARIRSDGAVVSMEEVYRLLCSVHPDLGGSSARPMTPEEVAALDFCPDITGCFEAPPDMYTDGVPRAQDEAHIGWEQIRVYVLPPIPQDLLAALSDERSGDSTTSTTQSETQRWQVTVSGFEIDEMDPYWRITTRVRGAIRFDYTMQGEFTLTKQEGRLVFDTGTISYVDVQVSEEYQPVGSWNIVTPLQCPQCSRISAGRPLTGEVIGDDLRLTWGTFRPEVKVDAQIKVPCLPMPDCATWKDRVFTSQEFFQTLNGRLLPLAEGAISAPVSIDPASGIQWLDYTITLRKVEGS